MFFQEDDSRIQSDDQVLTTKTRAPGISTIAAAEIRAVIGPKQFCA